MKLKTVLASALVLAGIAGAAGVMGNNVSAADGTATAPADQTTTATVEVKAGALTYTNVNPAFTFATDQAGDVQDLYNNGGAYTGDFSADGKGIVVSDWLGNTTTAANGWTLTATAAGWTGGSTAGNNVLNDNSTLTSAGKTLAAGTTTTIATGGAGDTTVEAPATLALTKGIYYEAGSYTNTITWNLTAAATPTAGE